MCLLCVAFLQFPSPSSSVSFLYCLFSGQFILIYVLRYCSSANVIVRLFVRCCSTKLQNFNVSISLVNKSWDSRFSHERRKFDNICIDFSAEIETICVHLKAERGFMDRMRVNMSVSNIFFTLNVCLPINRRPKGEINGIRIARMIVFGT